MGLGTKLLEGILKTISGLVTSVPSFIQGYNVSNQEATIEGELYISKRDITSSEPIGVNGKPVTVHVVIAAKGVESNNGIKTIKEALNQAITRPYYTPADTPDYNPANEQIALAISQLLGKIDADKGLVWSKNAQPDSLLDPLDPKSTTLSPAWKQIANALKYDVKCTCSGYPYGEMGNQSLAEIQNLIAVYPVRCGAVKQGDQASGGQVGYNASDVNPYYLVMPILILIQQMLANYLDSISKQVYEVDGASEKSSEDAPPAADNSNENGSEAGMNQNAEASKKISVKLQKISGSTDIDLLGLVSDYEPALTLDTVDDVLSNGDFVDLITETPQTYDITVDDAGYDVCPSCTDLIIDPVFSLREIFLYMDAFNKELHIIHWMSIGNDMLKIHELAQQLYEELDTEIDELGELLVEKSGTVPDIRYTGSSCEGPLLPDCTYSEDFQSGLSLISNDIQCLLDTIDIAYPNQPSDVQSILDDWLRYWNKQLNYFIKREQEI